MDQVKFKSHVNALSTIHAFNVNSQYLVQESGLFFKGVAECLDGVGGKVDGWDAVQVSQEKVQFLIENLEKSLAFLKEAIKV